jgi:hypothetical protein
MKNSKPLAPWIDPSYHAIECTSSSFIVSFICLPEANTFWLNTKSLIHRSELDGQLLLFFLARDRSRSSSPSIQKEKRVVVDVIE